MKINGWKIRAATPTGITCERTSRTVRIPLSNGRPTLDWQSGFGAETMRGEITWMNPRHVGRILEAIG